MALYSIEINRYKTVVEEVGGGEGRGGGGGEEGNMALPQGF